MSCRSMFFFIADISGYTAFMIKNEQDITHGTLIITELIQSLVKQVELPMEISKLEGDAIFLFLPEGSEIAEPKLLTEKILRFFEVFYQKLRALESSTTCDCGACSNIKELDLKIVAHYGKAEQQNIGTFRELSGVDVILVHRLLKNQIRERCYLLMTEACFKRLSLPDGAQVKQCEEIDKDLGKIDVHLYLPAAGGPVRVKASAGAIFKQHVKLMVGGLLYKLHLKKLPHFRNFP